MYDSNYKQCDDSYDHSALFLRDKSINDGKKTKLLLLISKVSVLEP